jgi:hypothetical protein
MSYRSRLTVRTWDCICRQVVRLAGLRPSPAPAPALREGVNVLLTRPEEIQKVHAHVFAGLADAEEDQVVAQSLFRSHSIDYMPKHCEGFDRVLRVVVVPRHAVVS